MTDVWLYVCYEDRMHSPYWNATYFPRPDRWLLCPVDVCLMQFVCLCGPVISHLIKQTSGPLECSLQHPADGKRKLVRFQSCFLYMFAFRTLRNVLKKFSMCDLPTHYTTDKNHCRENEGSSASQEITRILWNTNVHYRVHNSASIVPTLCQTNPVHSIPCYFLISIYQAVFYFIHTSVYYYYCHGLSGLQSIAFKTILILGVRVT